MRLRCFLALFVAATLTSARTGLAVELLKVEANPAGGFSWPYYLLIPNTVVSPPILMVEPNNTGTVNDDISYHDAAARSLIQSKTSWADELGTPYLVPVFPRPATNGSLYTHALDRKTITTTAQGLVRIDLQLIAMTRDAQTRLLARGIAVDSRFFMVGASASGSFASRFTMLHPDTVKAASIGCPGFGPTVPVQSWNGQTLPYPEGIADLEQLVGTKFDAESFKKVPLQVWVGDEDYNIDPWWNLADPEVALISAAFGGRQLYQRWPKYEVAFASVSSLCQFVVFPTMGHSWANWPYIREFFNRYRTSTPPPLPKPALYTIYFPHVAASSPWATEVGVTNTSDVDIKGTLRAHRADGTPTQSAALALAPMQHKEIAVGSFFQLPSQIAYLSFVCDSGFIAGYTRFSQPGNRVSLAAGTGTKTGWFTKLERDGWTGIAFVNVETENASVTLNAIDANGGLVSSATLVLTPGQKYVGMATQMFTGDMSRARYVKYSSDRRLLGFTVSSSTDGQMLDGLHCPGQYIYQ